MISLNGAESLLRIDSLVYKIMDNTISCAEGSSVLLASKQFGVPQSTLINESRTCSGKQLF